MSDSYKDTLTYLSNTIGTASVSANAGDWVTLTNTDAYTTDSKYWDWIQDPFSRIVSNNKKGDDDMRYLYEVILVNPKNDKFEFFHKVARSEVCALMYAYEGSKFNSIIAFDDLKTSCRILMEWKKEYPKTAVE